MKKSIIALILIFALSLLLTACSNGGDTPTGDNSTPGSSSAPAETPDEIAGPSEMKPVTDISKYYSPDGKEFNIVQCAEDLGFDVSYTQYIEDVDNDDIRQVTLRSFFPFKYSREYEAAATEDGVNYHDITYTAETFMCYYSEKSEFIFVNSIYFFSLQGNSQGYNLSNVAPYGSYPLADEVYSHEKNVLLTGRPAEDDAAPVYANAEIIDAWVWYMEYMNSFEDISDFELLMKVQYDFDLTKYLSGDEFDLLAYAGDLGFEVPDTIWYSGDRQVFYCEFLFEIGGKIYNAYFNRSVRDEPYANVTVFEYPWKADENIGVAGMGFNTSAERNIRIIGAEGEGAEGLWLNGVAFYQLVWYLDQVAAANSLGELSEIDFNWW